jgi:hypothetical protein
MTTPYRDDDDDLDLRLEDLWRRKAAAHRTYHSDPSDPDYEFENDQRARWSVGSTWTQPAPRRGVK